MQVYIELALLENFCMDFTLLYAAKIAVKNPAGYLRLFLASAAGAAVAVLFPLLKMGAAWSVVVKILSGFLMCLVAGKFKNVKSYFKFSVAFLVFTALLGGALVGVFSLAGLEYISGEGFLLSKIPIGIPLFFVLFIIIGARKLASRLRKTRAETVKIKVFLGESVAEVQGFFDSGNKVYCRGAPVSIIPSDAAKKIIDETCIKEGVKIHTVAGSREIKIFTADRVEIDLGGKINNFNRVKIGISPKRIERAVLHCDLLEDTGV